MQSYSKAVFQLQMCGSLFLPELLSLSPAFFLSAVSATGRGRYAKRIRYHGKGMFGIMKISRCHYFVKLVEGPPPPPEPPKTGFDQAKEYVQQLRNRTIAHTL